MTKEIHRHIRRASLLLIVSMMISRVIGFFRELALAHLIGASEFTDVYLASFTVPDFMNYLMAAGALSVSFIPILSPYVHEGQKKRAEELFRGTSTIMGLVFLVFVIIVEIFARTFASWVAPGFSEMQLTLLTDLIRIILPAQLFFFWGGLANAVQQTHGQFLYTAMGGIFYNLGIVTFGVLLHAKYGVAAFSIGVLAGAIASHGLLQWWGLRKVGFSAAPLFHFSPEFKQDFKRYLLLSIPLALGFSLVVTDEWFSKYFGSELEARSVSWLSYARTLMRIPIAVLGQVAGIASFPFLTKLWVAKSYDEYGDLFQRELEKVWALAPLAAILLVTHAIPITHFIFRGGRFTADDMMATANVLRWMAIGIPFWIAQILLARAFYSAGKTWLPPIAGGLLSVCMFPVYGYAAKQWGAEGLAVCSSAGIALYTAVLWILLQMHFRKFSSAIRFRKLYLFVALWSFVLVLCYGVSVQLLKLGLYQETRMSGLLDAAVATAVLGGIALFFIRKVFPRVTGEPLI